MKRFFPISPLLLMLAAGAFAQTPASPAPSATPQFPAPAAPFPAPNPEEAKKLAAMPAEDLISMLQEESKPSAAVDPTDPVYRLDLGARYQDFLGGEFGGREPKISPVMHELITRGPAALPALIAHLADTRTTNLTVGSGFDGVIIASRYDARDRTPSKHYPGISDSPFNAKTYGNVKTYNVMVGDFCYAIIGQIVNRDLDAAQYWAPMHVVVNTPVEVPQLAMAVKNDWEGIKPEDLRKSLEEDAARFSDAEALKRLYLYFPGAADATAVKLLKRPLLSPPDFLEYAAFHKGTAEERDKLLAGYREKNTENDYHEILKKLLWLSTTIRFPEDDPDKMAAQQMLGDLSPKIEPFNPPIFNSAGYGEQGELIEHLGQIRSKAVDDAVAEILRQVSGEKKDMKFDLAIDCANRLLDKPEYEDTIRSSLQKIIAIQIATGKDWVWAYGDDWGVKRMQAILDKLPKKAAKPPVKAVGG